MSAKRYRPVEIISKLRETDILIGQGKTLPGPSRQSVLLLSPVVAGDKNMAG